MENNDNLRAEDLHQVSGGAILVPGKYYITDGCVCCYACIDQCVTGAISEGYPKFSIDPNMCVECGTCQYVCGYNAVEIYSE